MLQDVTESSSDLESSPPRETRPSAHVPSYVVLQIKIFILNVARVQDLRRLYLSIKASANV